MAHGDTREGTWGGNWRMEWVASTLHTTSERGVSSTTNADAHSSAASTRLNWLPRRFKWTGPFRRKTKCGFCACAIRFRTSSTLQLKPDGTRWRTGGEMKGKLANEVGCQYSSHYLGTWCIQHYYRWCAYLGSQLSTELTPPTDLKGLIRFAERQNLVSPRVPSYFNWALPGIFLWGVKAAGSYGWESY
jgi:hypothetical protein